MLFAHLKGSLELLADRDPEEARTTLDPIVERVMEPVHRYEGAVVQVIGDGIMALFGAPRGKVPPRPCWPCQSRAHEHHVRAAGTCFIAWMFSMPS